MLYTSLLRSLLARKHAFGTEVPAEGAALSDRALDLQPRLVQLQDVLDDRQAQAGAAGLARAAGGHAVEAVGDPRQVRGGDAVAAVAHRKDRAAIGAARKDDRHITAGRRVAHRVGPQDEEGDVQRAGEAETGERRARGRRADAGGGGTA